MTSIIGRYQCLSASICVYWFDNQCIEREVYYCADKKFLILELARIEIAWLNTISKMGIVIQTKYEFKGM